MSSSFKIVLWFVTSTSVSHCKLVMIKCYSVHNDVVFFSNCSWHTFTKFTDQKCCVLNSVGVLLILTYATIQVVYCYYMLTFHVMFVVCKISCKTPSV